MRAKSLSSTAARQEIKRIIQIRRHQNGFKGNIPSHIWNDVKIAPLLEEAVQYILDEFCERDWELLRMDHEEHEKPWFEEKLQTIEQSLNGFVTYENSEGCSKSLATKASQSERDAEIHALTETQITVENDSAERQDANEGQDAEHSSPVSESDARAEAARHYLYWKIEGNSHVQEYRQNLAFTTRLWENEAVDFLSAPLTSVLSFRDFRELGLSPVTTKGKIVSTRRVRDKIDASAHGWYQDLEYEFTDGPVFEIVVEIEMPDGTKKIHTVQRSGKPVHLIYKAKGVDPLEEKQRPYSMLNIYGYSRHSFMRDQSAPVDKRRYPGFSHIRLKGYYDSVFYETVNICQYLKEQELFPSWSNAFQYLLTPMHYVQNTFRHSWDYYYLSGGTLPKCCHLTLPAWATPEEVSDYWCKVRQPQARKRGKPSAKSLDLFRFVLACTLPGTKISLPNREVKWEHLAAAWRGKYKEPLGRDKLARTFSSVLAALCLEEWNGPKFIPSSCFEDGEVT